MKQKTDVEKIQYPENLSASDRRLCRKMIVSIGQYSDTMDNLIVSCSGGIDSTVLAHAVGQSLRIKPCNNRGAKIFATAIYINHNLRPEEVQKEIEHVRNLSNKHLSFCLDPIDLHLEKGPGLQERARKARYEALQALAQDVAIKVGGTVAVLMAHSSNDNAETKLFQFIKGYSVNGIPSNRKLGDSSNAYVCRPFLNFSRSDIERYAHCFNLSWCEDSSNKTDNYTRNKIRHHLIPWIENNINSGFVRMLDKHSKKSDHAKFHGQRQEDLELDC